VRVKKTKSVRQEEEKETDELVKSLLTQLSNPIHTAIPLYHKPNTLANFPFEYNMFNRWIGIQREIVYKVMCVSEEDT